MRLQRFSSTKYCSAGALPSLTSCVHCSSGKLDAESLVDREGDVEEGERVDAEIVDGVALRRDLLARNIAGLRNDSGDRLERGGHAGAPVVLSMMADDIRARL